jgi:hypothetical protein
MRGLSAEEYKYLLLSVGTHKGKRHLSPLEVAEKLNESIKSGASYKEIAGAIQLDGTTMITRFIRLLDLHPDIKHLVNWGRTDATIPFSICSELAKLNKEDQVIVSKSILENNMNKSEVIQIVQLRKRSSQTIDQCIESALRMRPSITKLHIILGAINSEKLIIFLSSITQNIRDDLLKQAILEIAPELSNFSCRLGIKKFTIVGKGNVLAPLLKVKDNLESRIQESLFQRTEKPCFNIQ